MFVVLAMGCSLAAASPVQAAASEADDYTAIDAFIVGQLDTLNIPGASWAIVDGEQIVHTQSYGSGGNGQAPTAQTPFFIGSLTKSFTALAVMQLVEAGKVDLDAPVQRYLPWFAPAGADTSMLAAPVNVRQLLNQTSGLSQIPGMQGLGNFNDEPGAAEALGRLQAREVLARAGWGSLRIQQQQLQPAGVDRRSRQRRDIQRLRADAYFRAVGHAAQHHSQNGGAAGRIGGRAYDDFRFAAGCAQPAGAGSFAVVRSAHLQHGGPGALPDSPVVTAGRYGQAQVLSAEGITEMHTPAAEVYMFGERTPDYGMGWYVDSSGEEEVVMHWGETPDYFGYLGMLPEQRRGVALLVNADQHFYTYPLLDLGNGVADLLAGEEPVKNTWLILPWVLRALLLLPVLQFFLSCARPCAA